ncbi:hypothetical protein Pan54_07440 [Rubinisphaera italica]|uniref:Carboxypeptidase regulatory-like domain-containing protein n=2 Tax=Rubinisphaera italica TaxID=2527969 RepID=A0A5C5XDN7_9PLAN|nr:hypothetical protein Pan54_07440 [Rubinisphaera italica]
MNSCVWGVLLSVCSMLFMGCGGDGINRVDVEGKVTLDGAPLNEGASVTFIPIGSGPAAGAVIEGDQYSILGDRAPGPGEYRVEIRSPRPTGKQVLGTDGVTMEPSFEEAVPEKYNTNSELKANLSSGEKNTIDFILTK